VSNGSGYDIACAGAEGPLTYQLLEDQLSYQEIDFDPGCTEQLYFVYLGRKQNSGDAIIHYTQKAKKRKAIAKQISTITDVATHCKGLKAFRAAMDEHETIISTELGLEKIKDKHFSDFDGSIKSLGAWGGDFCLVASDMSPEKVKAYFKGKGLATIMSYNELTLQETPELSAEALAS